MSLFGDPFFWALVSMFGLAGAEALVGSTRLARIRSLGFVTVGMFALGRVVLVLPAVSQSRLVAGNWSWVVGGVIFAVGVAFMLPAFAIRPFTGPEAGVSLRSDGFYGIVRNPIYLADVLWCLGWAVMFRSEIGIALGSGVVGESVAANDSRGGEPRAETRPAVPRVQATSPWTYPPGAAAMIHGLMNVLPSGRSRPPVLFPGVDKEADIIFRGPR